MFPSKSDHKTKRKLNKYNELNLEGKIKILKHLESDFTHRKAADKFKISKEQVSNIFKNKDVLFKRYYENNEIDRSRKLRKTDNELINYQVMEYFRCAITIYLFLVPCYKKLRYSLLLIINKLNLKPLMGG